MTIDIILIVTALILAFAVGLLVGRRHWLRIGTAQGIFRGWKAAEQYHDPNYGELPY